MQLLNDDFVWPSDADRAENLALDRVCAELEDLVDRLEAAADVAADRQAVLDLAAQALGVDGEPHQGRDQRILEAIDALAAHVERVRGIRNAIEERCEYLGRPTYYRSVEKEERYEREVEALRDELEEALDEAPATSLARLKAQWQAEALASLRADWQAKGVLNPQESLMLMNREQELRRQAEGEDQ